MIACVGETLERARGRRDRARAQASRSRRSRSQRASTTNLVIAYEPVWAIGTGQDRDARDGARRRTRFIKALLDRAGALRRLGQARERGRAALAARVDGALVGGASLDPDSFAAICRRRFPLVTLVVLDGWGCAPAGPGNAVELAETPVFDGLWREYPHTTLEASGEAVGLPDGQMGNSEVGHLTIGSGRILFQDLMRVNRAVRGRLALRERGARRGVRAGAGARRRRPSARARLATAASTRTSTTSARCSSSRSARGWRSGPGSTRSPTAATSRRRPRSPTSPSCRPSGSRRSSGATTRWTATSAGSAPSARCDAIIERRGHTVADTVLAAVQRSYDAGITDEFIEPVVARRDAAARASDDAAIFFNFRPDRGRQLATQARRGGLRPDDDDALLVGDSTCPSPSASRSSRTRSPRRSARAAPASCTRPRRRSTRTSPTSSTAASRTSGRGRRGSSSRARATCRATTCKPEMSAREVAVAVRRRDRQRLPLRRRQLREPGHGRPHRLDPRRRRRRWRRPTRASGVVVEATHAAGGVCLVTADHGNAEQMLEPDGVSPHTAHTTNPVPLVVTTRVKCR